MDTISTVIAIMVGAFAIVGGISQAYRWWQTRTQNSQKVSRLRPETVTLYLDSQQKALEVWRLFDFHRNIKMVEVYVQEELHIPDNSPLGFRKSISNPIPEEEIFERLASGNKASNNKASGNKEANQIFIVEGQAGAGKSTMLRNWTLKLLAQYQASGVKQPQPLPIYFSLRHMPIPGQNELNNQVMASELAACLSKTIPEISDEAAMTVFSTVHALRNEQSRARRQSKVARLFQKKTPVPPEWIFFCDGLDEVAPELRPELLRWMQGLPRSIHVVLATRPAILGQVNLPRSQKYAMCDFTEAQISTFVTQWFHNDIALRDRFAAQITSSPSLRQLAAIPLLLTCLAIDVEIRQDPSFPEHLVRKDLLQRIVEILIDKWDAVKGGRMVNHAFVQLGMKVFPELTILHSYGSSFSYTELMAQVNKHAQGIGIGASDVEVFLRRITTGIRLLQGDPDIGYSFSHAVFFDFFFGRAVNLLVQKDKEMEDTR